MSQERFRLHETLLARPFKHNISHKFAPDVEIKWRRIKRPVMPLNNRRLNMLAAPNRFRITEKFEAPEELSTSVSRAVLEATCTPRLDHLSRPFVRTLVAMKKDKQFLGKAFVDTINERIAMSLDTIYYHNIKSIMTNEAERKRSTKSVPTKPCWDDVGDRERLISLANPKKARPPPPPRKRKRKKLEELKARIEKLSLPITSKMYKRPSQESVLKRLKISEKTLNYKATERILELAKNFVWKLQKPYEYTGQVPKSALEAKITPRVEQLAAPRPRANAPEMDLKENPYDISPAALKYKPSHRIQQLAKPVKR